MTPGPALSPKLSGFPHPPRPSLERAVAVRTSRHGLQPTQTTASPPRAGPWISLMVGHLAVHPAGWLSLGGPARW